MSKSLTVDSSTIKFQIWDTAGQERVSELLICCKIRVLYFPLYHTAIAAMMSCGYSDDVMQL